MAAEMVAVVGIKLGAFLPRAKATKNKIFPADNQQQKRNKQASSETSMKLR